MTTSRCANCWPQARWSNILPDIPRHWDQHSDCLLTTLHIWEGKKSCTRKELETLVGHLNHACKVVRLGRSFLCHMLNLLLIVRRIANFLYASTRSFGQTFAWWLTFINQWNGVSFLSPPNKLTQHHLTTDTSGGWGCGAWFGNKWFQVQWDDPSL